MGIKFNCPNGHKLNVKSFLAGKKGVCPECGARFRIPAQPAEEDHDDGPALDVTQQAGNPQPSQVQPATKPVRGEAAPVSAAQPIGVAAVAAVPVGAVPTGAVPAAGVPVGVPAGVPVGQPVANVGPTAPGPMPPSIPVGVPAAGIDPIAENPAAIWYVRPPSGGQYGPARGDIMRKWIAEGRVTRTSLVWREGWPDWRNAGEAIPGLGAGAPALVDPIVPIVTPTVARTTGRYVAGKKKSNALAITALVLLVILCLMMVGVLVVVLGGVQSGQPTETSQTPVSVSVPSEFNIVH